jgi:hypothetical protein
MGATTTNTVNEDVFYQRQGIGEETTTNSGARMYADKGKCRIKEEFHTKQAYKAKGVRSETPCARSSREYDALHVDGAVKHTHTE